MPNTEQLIRADDQQPADQWWVDDPHLAEMIQTEGVAASEAVKPDLPPIPTLTVEQSTELTRDMRTKLEDSVRDAAPLDPTYYSALEALGAGWKAHLNFDHTDPSKSQKVDAVLADMRDKGLIPAYKIGDGGGVDSDQPGKESTVYVGSRARLEQVSAMLESSLGDTLSPVDPGVMQDDVQVSPLVAARFDIHRLDDRFGQYGAQGHALLTTDLDPWNGTKTPEAATAAAHDALEKTYGQYFTG